MEPQKFIYQKTEEKTPAEVKVVGINLPLWDAVKLILVFAIGSGLIAAVITILLLLLGIIGGNTGTSYRHY